MSDENKDGAGSPEKFDIDSVEVKIFMIAKNPNSFKGAADFLTRRGWPTTTIGNISQAISAIVQEAPEILLISVNHPNPNVMKLPNLLTQAMNTICIGFTETGDAVSTAKLNGSGFRYKISGYATGPSIHRQIRQILQTIYDPESTSTSERSQQEGQSGPSHVTVKGSQGDGNTNEYEITLSGEGHKGSAKYLGGEEKKVRLKDIGKNKSSSKKDEKSSGGDQNNIAKLLSQLSEPGNQEDSSKNQGDTKEKFPLKEGEEPRKSKPRFPWQKSPERNSLKNQENRPGASFDLKQSRSDKPLMTPTTEAKKSDKRSDKPLVQEKSKEKPNLDMATTDIEKEEPKLKESQAEKKNRSIKQNDNNGEEFSAEAGKENPDENRLNKSNSNQETKLKQTGLRENLRNLSNIKPNSTKEMVAFQQLIQESLKSVVEPPDAFETNPVTYLSNVGIIAIDSDNFHGYLVIGLSCKDEKQNVQFLKKFKKSIERQVEQASLSMRIDDSFLISTESFDFNNWSNQRTQFFSTVQNGKFEVSAAFFPIADRLPVMKANEYNPDMAKISISNISTKHPVNFKMYLHLKRNEKFYLYLNDGRNLLDRQKQKFEELESSTELHIEKGDFENYKKYLATKVIRDESHQFILKKKKKAS